MFPKIIDYVELLSEDDVWEAVKNGYNLYVIVLERTDHFDRGYKLVDSLDNLRSYINLRNQGMPIMFFIKKDDLLYCEEESEE